MTDCKDLTKAECDFLNELGKVFKRHKTIAQRFQVAHKITHRVKDLKAGEYLVITPKEVGEEYFVVTKHKNGAAVAAGADPCCVWVWVDPPGDFECAALC